MTQNAAFSYLVGGIMGISRSDREKFETKKYAELKHELRQIQQALGVQPTRESTEDMEARLNMLPSKGLSLNLWGIPQNVQPQRKPEPWEWALLWLVLLGFGVYIFVLIQLCSV